MSDFPALEPTSISFDYGVSATSEYNAFGVGPVRFRHSEFINSARFLLEYEAIQQSDINLIRAHYRQNQGIAGEFSVPPAILGNVNIIDATSKFRYLETPVEEHFGVYFNLSITLVASQGLEPAFTLNGGPAVLPAEATFSKYVFDGTEPFILNGTTAALATLILKAD